MRLGLELSISLVLQSEDAVTLSIFPEVERWLNEDGDHQRAFEFVAAKKRMEKYRSMIDFLFCETFEHMRPRCFAFYRNDEPPLRDTINDEQRARFSKTMLVFLQIAYDAYCEKRALSWKAARDEALSRA